MLNTWIKNRNRIGIMISLVMIAIALRFDLFRNPEGEPIATIVEFVLFCIAWFPFCLKMEDEGASRKEIGDYFEGKPLNKRAVKVSSLKKVPDYTDFLLWLYYNKRNISVSEIDVKQTVSQFFSDTSGTHKNCKCENKGKAVNGVWVDWHCTTCLKPLK